MPNGLPVGAQNATVLTPLLFSRPPHRHVEYNPLITLPMNAITFLSSSEWSA